MGRRARAARRSSWIHPGGSRLWWSGESPRERECRAGPGVGGRRGRRPGRCYPGSALARTLAPIAQGIEHCPPEAGAEVRILLGAHLPISRVGAARGRSRLRDRPLVRPGPASSPRRTRAHPGAVRRTREHTRRGPRRVSGSRRVVLGPTGGAGLEKTVAKDAAGDHVGRYWETPVARDQTDPPGVSNARPRRGSRPTRDGAAHRPRLGAWQTTTTPPPSATS